MMPRLLLRGVSIGCLASAGILLTISLSLSEEPKPKRDKGPVKKDDAKPAPAKPATLTRVTLDKAGVGTFVYKVTKEAAGPRLFFFRAGDFDDAARSLKVTTDKSLVAIGGPHPILPFLLTKKDTSPAAKTASSVQLSDLLDTLRGQGVEVSDGTTPKTGTLLSIDTVGAQGKDGATPAGAPAQTSSKTLTLWSADKGVFVIPLTASTVVKFTDARLVGQVQEALDEMARGNGLPSRAFLVNLPDGNSTVTYRHRVPAWRLQYELALDPSAKPASALLSGRVSVRNTTPTAWDKVELTLAGLPGATDKTVPGVSLLPDQVATISVNPTLTVGIDFKEPAKYTNRQATPNPDQKLTLTLTPKDGLASLPVSVTIVEDGREIGTADVLDFGATGEAIVKLSPYKLITVSQGKSKTIPTTTRFANGILDYVETRTTRLVITNDSKSNKKLAVAAEDGWKTASSDDAANTFDVGPRSTVAKDFNEIRSASLVAVATWNGLGDFVDSLLDADPLKATLTLASDRQKSTAAVLDDLDKKRQSLSAAIQAIAMRQPAFTGAVPGILFPQLAQDEAAVARLRYEMDCITAKKAALLRELEAFICGLSVPRADLPPPVPAEEELKVPR